MFLNKTILTIVEQEARQKTVKTFIDKKIKRKLIVLAEMN